MSDDDYDGYSDDFAENDSSSHEHSPASHLQSEDEYQKAPRGHTPDDVIASPKAAEVSPAPSDTPRSATPRSSPPLSRSTTPPTRRSSHHSEGATPPPRPESSSAASTSPSDSKAVKPSATSPRPSASAKTSEAKPKPKPNKKNKSAEKPKERLPEPGSLGDAVLKLNIESEKLSALGELEEADKALRTAYAMLQRTESNTSDETVQRERDVLLAMTLNNLGCLERRRGNNPKALLYLEACLRLERSRGSNSVVTLLNLAAAANAAFDYENGIKYAKEVLKLLPPPSATTDEQSTQGKPGPQSIRSAAKFYLAASRHIEFRAEVEEMEDDSERSEAASEVLELYRKALESTVGDSAGQSEFIRQKCKAARDELKPFVRHRYDGEVPWTSKPNVYRLPGGMAVPPKATAAYCCSQEEMVERAGRKVDPTSHSARSHKDKDTYVC